MKNKHIKRWIGPALGCLAALAILAGCSDASHDHDHDHPHDDDHDHSSWNDPNPSHGGILVPVRQEAPVLSGQERIGRG